MEGSLTIFYDGCCALCNRSVRHILKKDKKGLFSFASLQSQYSRNNVPERYIDEVDSIVLWTGSEFMIKSKAVFTIVSELPTCWKILNIFSILPLSLTDKAYDLIARLRYRIFGRYETCPLPPVEYRSKFIDLAEDN